MLIQPGNAAATVHSVATENLRQPRLEIIGLPHSVVPPATTGADVAAGPDESRQRSSFAHARRLLRHDTDTLPKGPACSLPANDPIEAKFLPDVELAAGTDEVRVRRVRGDETTALR
jgi:hypothetical protein